VNVAEIDVPAVLAFWILAAGEGGHGLLKRSRDASGKPLGLWCPERAKQKGRPKAASVFVGPRRPTANSTIADWHSARRRAAPLLSIPSVRSFHWHRIRWYSPVQRQLVRVGRSLQHRRRMHRRRERIRPNPSGKQVG